MKHTQLIAALMMTAGLSLGTAHAMDHSTPMAMEAGVPTGAIAKGEGPGAIAPDFTSYESRAAVRAEGEWKVNQQPPKVVGEGSAPIAPNFVSTESRAENKAEAVEAQQSGEIGKGPDAAFTPKMDVKQ